MPSVVIITENKSLPHFVTLTVRNWYYLFDRFNRWEILADTMRFLQKERQLQIFAYVFMLNHIHMILQAPDLISCMQSFKRHTTKKLKENLLETEPRVLTLFSNNGKENFWHSTNMPEVIESDKFLQQKITYIHTNPVKKQYVVEPGHWYWSSAHPDSPVKIDMM